MAILSSPTENAISIQPGYLRAKRILDIVCTFLLLLPLSVIMLIIALTICLDSQGPIFFRQRRVGLNGIEFTMLKFRSMHVDCDDTIHREAVKRFMKGDVIGGEGDAENQFKLAEDPRVTRIGRFLRKTSLDELPQFINVLRGEMSLVGPRPPLPYEVELYDSRASMRLSGKPGLTGLWQVYGRSRVTFYSMIEMDIEYLKQQSLILDLKLILLTLPVMLLRRGGV